MNTSIKPTLWLLLFLAFSSQSSLCLADLFEDQFNQLKTKQVASIKEVNRKYAEHLAEMLDKVKANKDEVMGVKIRQEMVDIGFPHKDDWLLGEWTTSDSDGARRTYVFKASGAAAYTKRNGEPATGVPPGSFTKEANDSYRVTLGTVLLMVTQNPGGGLFISRWNIKDYPNKGKAITGTAKR